MNYYNEIKNELIDNEIHKKVKDYSKNKYELERYYNVGKLLFEAGNKYGEYVIGRYSQKLTIEIGKKYDKSTLFKIRKFYLIFSNEKVAPVVPQLSWSHCLILLPINDLSKINYYIKQVSNRNLSKRQLQDIIKSNEYERLDINTQNKLLRKEENTINDFIKHPIIINNKCNYREISEKMLKQLILEDIDNFLFELGDGFSYIKNEYKIKLGDRYNYIDILLFNIKFNCYVVIELKVTELKKEHIGFIKAINHDKTIGIIIAKYNNEFVMRYCSDPRIYNTTYELV